MNPNQLSVGQRIRLTGTEWAETYERSEVTIGNRTPEGLYEFSHDPGSEWDLSEPDDNLFGWEFVDADPVNSPTHYQHPSGIEVIDITRHESFLRGNVIKYVLRAPYKGNEIEDIKKALKYLTWELERLEKQSDA